MANKPKQADTPLEKMIEGPILPVEVPRVEYDRVIGYLVSTGFLKDLFAEITGQNEEENGTASCRLLWNRLDKWQKEWVAENPKERKLVINDAMRLIEWKIEKEKKAGREEAMDDIYEEMENRFAYSDNNSGSEILSVLKSLRSNPVS